jgi:hypothetical protein
MNGMNKLFMDDPIWFLNRLCVDNKAMQEGVDGARNLERLNGAKFGVFDLVPVSGGNTVTLRYASPMSGHVITGDPPIFAYWCPFLAGGGLPGWVDIPRANPPRRLMFTAAMQGCALVVTKSPASNAHFRVFHNQHPETASTWSAMSGIGITGVISNLGYEVYGNPTGPDGGMTNAFNLLWRPPGRAWSYVSQSNRFVPLPMGTKIERDLTKPILDLPAGV